MVARLTARLTATVQSVLTDEFLAHRLGLIPLAVRPSSLEYSRFCSCMDYCERCSYVLTLDVKCSLESGERKREVTSKDLLCADPSVIPVGAGDEYGVLIAKLGPGQVRLSP